MDASHAVGRLRSLGFDGALRVEISWMRPGEEPYVVDRRTLADLQELLVATGELRLEEPC